jgi:FlgD Ig-like domain
MASGYVKRIAVLMTALYLLISDPLNAATSYYVRLRPAGTVGLSCKVAFELTHTDSLNQNQLTILNFAHDGTADSAEWVGGPVAGDLLDGSNPASSTMVENQFFENGLVVPFVSFGSVATFRLDLTEHAAGQGMPPDELSVSLLGRSGDLPYPTSDGLGADALFAIDVTGQAGGELSVFSPMTFIPPDTLSLEGNLVSVETEGKRSPPRLRGTVVPNPSTGSVRLRLELPASGHLRIRVFDLAGRLIATPFSGNRSVGIWSFQWDARDAHGAAVPAGVYVVQVETAHESLIRRIVLAR